MPTSLCAQAPRRIHTHTPYKEASAPVRRAQIDGGAQWSRLQALPAFGAGGLEEVSMAMACTTPPLHSAAPLQRWELPAFEMLLGVQATDGFWLPACVH